MFETGARERRSRDVVLWVGVLFWLVSSDPVDVITSR